MNWDRFEKWKLRTVWQLPVCSSAPASTSQATRRDGSLADTTPWLRLEGSKLVSEPFLILHKVCGSPAFDIAVRVQIGDEEGWIIPTSGHRAYPWRWWPLYNIQACSHEDMVSPMDEFDNGVPIEWPDHYATSAAPRIDINTLFSPRPSEGIRRRL